MLGESAVIRIYMLPHLLDCELDRAVSLSIVKVLPCVHVHATAL